MPFRLTDVLQEQAQSQSQSQSLEQGQEEQRIGEIDTETLAGQTLIGAGVGLAVGGPMGAAVGALEGALSYLAGVYAAKAVYGLVDDKKAAQSLGRATELLVSVLMPTSTVGKATRLVEGFETVAQKIPHVAKLALKASSVALATGYIVEPYTEDGQELGVAALAAGGFLLAHEWGDLGKWAIYTARYLGAEKFPEKIPTVLPTETMELFGKKVPKLEWQGLKPVVKAVDPFTHLREIDLSMAPLRYRAEKALSLYHKLGVEPFSKESIELGQVFFEKEFGKAALESAEKLGVRQDSEKLAMLIEAVQDHQLAELYKAQLFEALGGAGKSYLEQLGNQRRMFLHTFALKLPEDLLTSEQAKAIKKVGSVAEQIERVKSEAATLKEFGGEGFVRGEDVEIGVRPMSGLRLRGQILADRKKIRQLEKEFKKEFGRDMQVGDTFKGWTKVVFKEGEEPVLWKELPLGLRKTNLVFTDLAASLFRTVSEDFRVVKELYFYSYLDKLGRELGMVSDVYKPGLVKLVDTLPGGRQPAVIKQFGRLTGKYVSEDLVRVLKAFKAMETYTPKFKTLAQLNRIWKYGFLSLNLKSYVNAFLGNIVLAFTNGLDPFHILYEAGQGLLRKDELYQEALSVGVLRKELELDREALRLLRQKEKLFELSKGFVAKPDSKLEHALAVTEDFITGRMMKAYASIDDMFRLGAFRILRQKGVPAQVAAEFVLDAFGYYGNMPVIVRGLRDTIYPFISFQFRIFPQLLKAFMQYPERFALTALFVEGLQRAAFKEMYGDNWVEGMKYEELVNARYMKPKIAGLLADFVRVPKMGELPGGYMYVGFLPWNLPLAIPQMNADVGGVSGILPILLIQNPIIRFVSGVMTHIDPATGMDITKMAGPGRLTASYLQYALRVLAPSPGVNHYLGELLAKEGWLDPLVSWFNYFGTYPDGSPVGTAHMLYNLLGPAILKYDPEYNLRMALNRLQAVEHEYRKAYYKAALRGAPEHVLVERAEDLERAFGEVWQKKIEYIAQYAKAFGEGGE